MRYSLIVSNFVIEKDFEIRKRLLLERTNQKHIPPRQLASLDKDFTGFPFLQVCLLIFAFHDMSGFGQSRRIGSNRKIDHDYFHKAL